MTELDLPKNVLVVGEGALAPVETALAATCPTWRVTRAHSMLDAIETVEVSNELDAIVVADVPPGLSIATLFEDVAFAEPRLARIAMTDNGKNPVRKATLVHEVLERSAEAIDLRDAIERATTVQMRLHDPALADLLKRIESLPSPPAFAIELNALLNTRDVEIENVAKLIESDVAMTARILRLVNSAAFGLSQQFDNVLRAVAYLGLQSVANLANALLLLDSMSASELDEEVRLLNAHSNEVAAHARDETGTDDAYIAGLLHDVGLLVLASSSPNLYLAIRDAVSRGATLESAELDSIGASHAALGAWLLERWNFPFSLVEAVARSHDADHDPIAVSPVALAVYEAELYEAEQDGSTWWEPGRLTQKYDPV